MGIITSFLSVLVGYILPFLLVMSLIVVIHELGHYLVGRWSGIKIMAFSFGFGPELVGVTDSRGTRWKISAIPLGGYVRFYGDADAASSPDFEGLDSLPEEERAKTFMGASLWKRAATVAAGPIFNFILAVLLFAGLFMTVGKMVADPVVAEVVKASPAEKAGILPGDRFIALDGNHVASFSDISRYISVRPESTVKVTLERAGQTIDVTVVPDRSERKDKFGNKMEIGVIGVITNESVGKFRQQNFTPLQALGEGVAESVRVVTGTWDYLSGVVVGRLKPDQVGGPIRVAQTSGQMATLGISALIYLAAVLSVSIGLLNLLPVPVLDGGHLMFYAVEAVMGRPVGEAAQSVAFRIGMALVLSLMVFATWNDISSLLG